MSSKDMLWYMIIIWEIKIQYMRNEKILVYIEKNFIYIHICLEW